MAFWEYETFLDAVNQDIKDENKRNEKEQGGYGNMNPGSLMRQAQRSMPKMPSMPKMH